MEKRKEINKKEWQRPAYKSLKFSQTYNGWVPQAYEGTKSGTVS